MPEEPKNEAQTKKTDPHPPSTELQNDSASPADKRKESQKEKKEPQSIPIDTIGVSIKEDKWYRRQPKIANIISVGGLILAAVIFYYTKALFIETQKSTSAAITSAQSARDSYLEQRANDSILRIRDSISSNRELDEWQKEHRAFLNIKNVSVKRQETGFEYITPIVENIGSQPVVTDSTAFVVHANDIVKETDSTFYLKLIESLGKHMSPSILYIDRNSPQTFTQTLAKEGDKPDKFNPSWGTFVAGRIIYTNLVSEKKGVFEFFLLIREDSYEIFYAKNYEK